MIIVASYLTAWIRLICTLSRLRKDQYYATTSLYYVHMVVLDLLVGVEILVVVVVVVQDNPLVEDKLVVVHPWVLRQPFSKRATVIMSLDLYI